jgi:seryl-tRNA synthetase
MQRLRNQLKQKKISQADAQKEFARLDSNRRLLQTTYDDLLIKQKEMQTYAKAPGATKQTIDEINRLNTEVASLRTQLDELDQLRSISVTG